MRLRLLLAAAWLRMSVTPRVMTDMLAMPPSRSRELLQATERKEMAMPRISSFFGIVIEMYFEDDGFPHFHAMHADGKARIRIDTLEPLSNTLPRRQLRFVLAWAELHREELAENWRRARVGETLTEIEPLR
jgi:hypothetical protein